MYTDSTLSNKISFCCQSSALHQVFLLTVAHSYPNSAYIK